MKIVLSSHYTPASMKWKAGYTGFKSSVHTSLCGQNRVHSVTSTILLDPFHIYTLLSNLKRCVVCKVFGKIPKFEFLANFSNL